MLNDADKLVSEDDLRRVYKQPAKAVVAKTFSHLDPHSRHYLELSPFFCLGSGGSSQTGGMGDVSPRAAEPGFVHVLDDTHIAFPDRPGNNRLDMLTNLIHEPAVGLLFFLPGVEEMLRINGVAHLTVQADLRERVRHDNKLPRSGVVIEICEVYFHCTKALKRSQLWNPEVQLAKGDFPTHRKITKDQFKTKIPAKMIDLALDRDSRKNLY